MRSFSVTALFTLAVFTECLGAQDRSRSRSGPIRSVPVAADIKRHVDFDCPEEFGYYPHPTDCTLYYVCVFGGALLESCTGGLMYSHELQTCDWPRNVGCDATGAVVAEDLERLNEREPPPPPPSRRNPPPQPRAQPNPVITSRGQPKFNRQEYEKQQQLYADVDDLPPVEEIESDRQQRVYRGQPSTIGQVQKDRDGYGVQAISSGRTLNSNIIPSSINQNSKIGSFSFGTQVDDRRSATITPAPQTYSLEPTESITPSSYSASPRPKMLYNGSQAYSPDQYDPYYAVYDEDGELYKDTDYVQQYNTASLRPAVQQTYRGTPPPARRPVETYTPRPSLDDYDDALIQGQISNQNQYQTSVRQPTRGDGNELGYEHIPSSVRTTVYEAPPSTSYRTTPSTTSTSTTTTTTTTTTTRRPTTAPYTEAMTPSRYTPRSSTDENRIRVPASSANQPSIDESTSLPPSTLSPVINFSSLAKPFEKTNNSYSLDIPSTEQVPTRIPSRVTNKKANNPVKLVQESSNESNKKIFSLTTGFSIRRNLNNTKNPYTLTLISKPFDNVATTKTSTIPTNRNNKKQHLQRIYYDTSITTKKSTELTPVVEANAYNHDDTSFHTSLYKKDTSTEAVEDEEISIYLRPPVEKTSLRSRTRSSTIPTTTDGSKYYLKTVLKRPAVIQNNNEESTENIEFEEPILERNPQDVTNSGELNMDSSIMYDSDDLKQANLSSKYTQPIISPYKTLVNLRNNEKDKLDNNELGLTSPISSTVDNFSSTTPTINLISSTKPSAKKPSYYLYHLEDEVLADKTTEVLNSKVKNVIRSFINNLPSSSSNFPEYSSSSYGPDSEEKVVNIGFPKKKQHFVTEKPRFSNFKHVKIITEPNLIRYISPTVETITITGPNKNFGANELSSSSTTSTPSNIPEASFLDFKTDATLSENSPNPQKDDIQKEVIKSKFASFTKSKSETEKSRKYQKIIDELGSSYSDGTTQSIKHFDKIDSTPLTRSNLDELNVSTETVNERQVNDYISEIASTTSTTKSTTTLKIEVETKPTTKSLSFPTRASRINPAIKLAVANLGSGRRSYQSSSNCSTDNSLQVNPKCNEIKYQRPTSTRGRGSAHYSTSGGSDTPQQAPNRGTPPTRNRPTLKPSTSIVAKVTEVDIYTNPPRRPAPVYPQPTPDKTAAKCRKDVCLLPDCFCGGKDIPGDLPLDKVPQIVLLTFDDSVNDLNKGLYSDLFEKGRVNPNGCPISATFYVSHEWTDYSQVQNLYAAGHEMASHTVSHSFGEQFSQKKWNREVGGQREILAAYGGVKLEDVRGMRAPFLSVGGNKMFKMLYDSNFTYDSSLPVYENKPPSWPYTLDYKLFHDCMIPPCPTKSYPGVWEVPMVMWQDLNGGRCSMGDACANPPDSDGVYKMILKNFDRHYNSNRAPFGLFYHAAWFTQPHHKEGFIKFLDFINKMNDVWIVTNWQALQWVRDPTPISRLDNFQPFQCNYQDRPRKCNNPKVCNLWHKSGVRYMRTCQPCPEIYPWTGKSGIRSSRIDNDIEE